MIYPNLEFFTGRKRSGKDFCLTLLAGALTVEKPVVRLSFSDELRRVAHYIYPWLPEDVEDGLKDMPFVHPDNPRGLTPRQIWLHLGGDNGLRYVQPDLFLAFFKRFQLPLVEQNPDVHYIVSDLRTPQEYEWALSTKCPITRISKADRTGIIEDDIEAFIDKMKVNYEFVNPFDGGSLAFINFYRNRK
ncbi:hypothetical protein DEEACLCL_00130 [Salmonella phage CRW-SP2]|nr:hypothetical protein DEEACLCL_00130 [Salmonella phage CRW-SP2]